jgi:hypothetical protein
VAESLGALRVGGHSLRRGADAVFRIVELGEDARPVAHDFGAVKESVDWEAALPLGRHTAEAQALTDGGSGALGQARAATRQTRGSGPWASRPS